MPFLCLPPQSLLRSQEYSRLNKCTFIWFQQQQNTTGHRTLNLKHHVMMVRHYLVSKNLHFRTKVKHTVFLINEHPANRSFFYHRLSTTISQ